MEESCLVLADTAQEHAIFPPVRISLWGRAAWKEDAGTRVRLHRDSPSFQIRHVEESQPRESMALNPSQKQVREQKENNKGF